jgi:hypothetical protein
MRNARFTDVQIFRILQETDRDPIAAIAKPNEMSPQSMSGVSDWEICVWTKLVMPSHAGSAKDGTVRCFKLQDANQGCINCSGHASLFWQVPSVCSQRSDGLFYSVMAYRSGEIVQLRFEQSMDYRCQRRR